MPDRTADLSFRLLQQNNGTLSRRAWVKEFSALTDEETQQIETLYRRVFDEAVPPFNLNRLADFYFGFQPSVRDRVPVEKWRRPRKSGGTVSAIRSQVFDFIGGP